MPSFLSHSLSLSLRLEYNKHDEHCFKMAGSQRVNYILLVVCQQSRNKSLFKLCLQQHSWYLNTLHYVTVVCMDVCVCVCVCSLVQSEFN